MAVQPIPPGYQTVTPYVHVENVEAFLDFLREAFDAEVKAATKIDDVIINAEVRIGTSMIMVAPVRDQQLNPSSFYLYLENMDEVHQQAVTAGASVIMEPADMFYGDRNSGVRDPFGNTWWLAKHIEDVTEEEIERRAKLRGKN